LEARKLEQTVDMSKQNETFKLMDNLWKITPNDVPLQVFWMFFLEIEYLILQVDKKKLAKAEDKLKEKSQKEAPPKRQRPHIQATASQAMNRRDAKTTEVNAKMDILDIFYKKLKVGGNLDIRLENVDISFGNKQLLTGAELQLVYGHRYGLVGRNGIGKTTLLKMISRF
jgi:ATP-binding cassette, subfamily F, member 3